jgi:PKD repeat protein
MSYCAQAVDYAAVHGADVINCSWGMSQLTSLTNAFLKARDSGALIISSAGNENSTGGDYYDYWTPGGEKVLVTTAASNSGDYKWSWSNYGYWVDITAPGQSIYSTYSFHHTAGYMYADGTSMATPHVVGAVALLRSHNPEITFNDVKDMLFYNCDTMPDVNWQMGFLGFGRLNTYNMFDNLPIAKFSTSSVLIGEAPLTVDFHDSSPYSPTSWEWDFDDGNTDYSQNPQHTYTDYGLYSVKLTVNDDFGTNTEVLKNLVMVTADTLKIADVSVEPETEFVVPVYLDNKYQVKNIIFPFMIRKQDGSVPSFIRLDSLVPDSGSRIAYFERIKKQSSDNINKRYTYILNSDYYGDGSNYLPPDTGHVFNLYFTQTSAVSGNEILTITDTVISGRELELESIVYDYTPVLVEGTISIATCDRGDANLDGAINILDVTNLIDWLYQGGWWPPDPICGDVNADGTINILDITYLINYLYKGGPPPPP